MPLLDEDRLAGRAALARVQEAGGERRPDGRVDVRVVEDDERPVAAHLEQQLLAGGPLRDPVPGLDRADETDRGGSGVGGDLVPDDGAGSGHEVEHAGWEVRGDQAFGQADGAQGGVRGRVPDHRVAGRQGGGDQLAGHRVRPVPWRDDPDDAARDAIDEDALVRVDRGRHEALDASRVGGRHPEVGDQLVDFAIAFGEERLALVERQGPCQVVAPFLDRGRHPFKCCRAVEGRQARPALARRSCCRDGPPRVGPGALGDGGDDLAA